MLAISRIVCDSHLERAFSNFSFLLLAPISSRSAEIGMMTKLVIRRFIDLDKTTITVSLVPLQMVILYLIRVFLKLVFFFSVRLL